MNSDDEESVGTGMTSPIAHMGMCGYTQSFWRLEKS